MTIRNEPTVTRNDPTTTTSSPMGGAVMAGIVSLIVNLIVTWIIALIFPTLDLGWALTMVAITSFFAGFFSYYGAARQSRVP
ncbi:MAG: hypothetical protein R3C14_26865 [Caldilineaceae bacterium]